MKKSFCIAFVLCCAAIAQTSTPTGAITGTLFDSIGDPVDNNTVQAKNTVSGAVFKATTSAKGKYTLADLPPGTYDITGSAPGLTASEKKGVSIQASQTVSLDIRLGDTTQLNTLGEDRYRITADTKRHAPPSGPTPRTVDGKPDLSGVWWHPAPWIPVNPSFSRRRLRSKSNAAMPMARIARRRIACHPGRCATVRYGSSCRARIFWFIFPMTRAPASIRSIWMAAAIQPIPTRLGTGTRSGVGTAIPWWWIASGSTRESGWTSNHTLTRTNCISWSATIAPISAISKSKLRLTTPACWRNLDPETRRRPGE